MANPVSAFWFDSTMNGAPVLTGEIGKRIGVIDACLLSGFGSKTLSSLTVAGGIATGVVSAGHQFSDQIVGLVEGASTSALNGKKRITVVNSTTFTFDATGVADQTATGTITTKVSPVTGWEKTYSGINKAAYRSTVIASRLHLLRVDDTAANYARVVAYETMSDVDTGSGPFPTAAQISGGGYWFGSDAASSATRQWALYADDTMFILVMYVNSAGTNPCANAFGDVISDHAGDSYNTILTFGVNTTAANSGYLHALNSTTGLVLARAYTQTGSAIQPIFYSNGRLSGGIGYVASGTAPNPGNNWLYISPITVFESTTIVRGSLPGLFAIVGMASSLTDLSIRNDIAGYPGRCFRVQKMTSGGVPYGGLIDITGPWR